MAMACLLPAPLQAQGQIEAFHVFVRALKPEALEAGVSEATFESVFAGMAPDCAQTGVTCAPPTDGEPRPPSFTERTGLPASCDRVPQKEFLEPSGYFPEGYIGRLVARGKALLERMRAEKPDTYAHIVKVEETYGVPVPILFGLWARETALGEARLDHNAVVALASLAFAGPERRRPWMRGHLIAALRMIERGDATFEVLRSSWAGATGLTQIMPEEYLRFAADGDGDGRRDIWTSVPDALATTARVLKHHGWGAPGGWGREVRVPEPNETFDCTLEGRVSRRPAGVWLRDLGIAPVTGGAEIASPPLDPEQPVWLLMPGGQGGPAFLVTRNFEVLRDYNPADLYALFIGTINDRLGCVSAGEDASCGFAAPWPEKGPAAFDFTVENLCRLQLGLKGAGMLSGEADGFFGPQTRTAIGRYQKARGERPTCYPTRALFETIAGPPRAGTPVNGEGAATR